MRNSCGNTPASSTARTPVGEGDAQADQRIHIEAAVLQRQPELAEERPAAPQHHRRGERQLEELAALPPAEHRRHGEEHQRHAQRRAHPQPAREVAPRCRPPPRRPSAPAPCRTSGRSPPSCTISGCIGQVYCAPLSAGAASTFLPRNLPGFGLEGVHAVLRAEVVGLALVVGVAGRGRGVDGHAADRVDAAHGADATSCCGFAMRAPSSARSFVPSAWRANGSTIWVSRSMWRR